MLKKYSEKRADMALVKWILTGHQHITEEEAETWWSHLMCPGKYPGDDGREFQLKSVRLQSMFVNHDTLLHTRMRHLDLRENEQKPTHRWWVFKGKKAEQIEHGQK